MTDFSIFLKKSSLVKLWFLTILLSRISFAADSSISFCEIAISTGGSCLILDKNSPDFKTLFPNTVLNILLNSLQPTITAVTPLQLPQGSTADILITAPKAHFNSTSLANLNLSGGIVVNTGKAILSPIQLIANVSIPTTTPVGFYDITAKTILADNQTETVSGRQLLQVIPASLQPTILSVTPLVVSRNTESTRLTIYGQNTHFSSQSLLDFGDTGLTVLNTMVKSPTQIQVDLNITSTAKVGFHKVKVKTNQELAEDIQPLGLLQVFESSQPPALVYLQPAQGRQWETLSINLLGKDTHFVQDGTTANLGEGIQVLQTTVISPTELTVVVMLNSEVLLGPRDVSVTTGAETVVFTNGFAVFSPATINFTPKVGKTGETVTLTIQGDAQTQFVQGQTELRMATSKNIQQLDTGIVVKSLEVQNAHLATAVIQIANQVTPGVRYLAVVTNNKEVMIPANGEVFEVISGAEARVKSLEPAAAVLGETKIVTLSGENTHFNAQSVVKWSGSGIHVNAYQVLSDNEIQLTLIIDNNAPVGIQGIQVITGTEIANLANAFTLLAPEPVEIVVNRRGNHGQVTSNLAGIQCGEDCTHRYAKGTVIVLTAEPDPDARFSGWEPTCEGQIQDSQITLTLTQDLICTAQFELRQETLVVEKQGAGNVSNLLGINCGEICQASYPTDTLVTLVATPAEHSVFQSWQGECGQSNENTTMITLDTSKTCTAIFIPKSENAIPNQETLIITTTKGKVTVTTSEILSCQDTCTYHYPKDTLITLEAKPDEGYRFVQWQGDCGESKASLISVALNTSKTCSAQFEKLEEQTLSEEYRLQVIIQGLGQVTSEPAGINCLPNSQSECIYTSTVAATVKLTALPANDSEFTGWEGDCQGQDTVLLMPMAGSKVCIARFEPVKRIEFEQSSMLVTEFGEVSTLGKRGHFITLPINKRGNDLVTVTWQVIDGTAKINEDYLVVSPSTLTGSTGEQLPGIEVFIVDDEIPEADETFKIALSLPTSSNQLGTVNQVEVVIQDNDKTIACTLPLQPAQQTVSLWQGESKVVTISGGSGQRYVEENFNHSLVTVTPLFPTPGEAKLILSPQQVGETQLIVKDECGNEAVLEILVQERSPLPDNSCIPDPKLVWQPTEQSITLFIGEEPRIYWLTGGQGQRQLVQAPDAQIVNLEKVEFPEIAGARITLSSRQEEGTTTLVVGDCAGHQAVMNLNIVNPENKVVCKALQPQQQRIAWLTTNQPLTLSFSGSQADLDLTQLPNPMVVTLETLKTLSSNLTQLVLSPRDHGQTQLELDNCAHQPVTVDIMVLKPNTLAYFCELDHRHDGLCVNPNETETIYGNGMAVNASGESMEIPVNWQTQLFVQSQPLNEIPIVTSVDELTVQVTTISEQLNYQPAELIVLLEHQGQFYFPAVKVYPLVPQEVNQVKEIQVNELDMPISTIQNQPRRIVSSKWRQWNEKWGDLKAVKLIDQLAAIHEETFSFNLLPDLNGELTLYIGYRLEDGRLVFNGHRPLRFIGANSMTLSLSGEYQDSRAYFNSQVQSTGEQIQVRTQIYPDPEHLYRNADLIMVAIYFSSEGEVLRFSRSSNEQWQPWDGQLSTLEVAEANVLLTELIEIEVFLRKLDYLVGTVNLYLGYRQRAADTLVFNGKAPIVLTLP